MRIESNSSLHTIVFIDIVGSTRLYETVGDADAKSLVTKVETLVAQLVTEGGGEVIEVVGDEVMCHFPDPDTAVTCAAAVHKRMDSYSRLAGRPISVRIGMHCGPVLAEAGRLFGDTLNVAARMAALAKGRQVITTEHLVARLSATHRGMVRRFDEVRIKGKRDPLVIYDLLWEGKSATVLQARGSLHSPSDLHLRLLHAGRDLLLGAAHAGFTIGRAQDCKLVVDTATASRSHATIDFQRGRFVLVDNSTNGTYVVTPDGQEVYLRREALPLWGKGLIGLGAPASKAGTEVLDYEVIQTDGSAVVR